MTTEVKTEVESLRALLRTFNDLPPKVKTDVRRDLRKTGDEVIAVQRAILDGPLPTGVQRVAQFKHPAINKKTGQLVTQKFNIYADRAILRPGRSRSDKDGGVGLREGIKAGLVTRVVTGTTRQGVDIRTQKKIGEMSTGWNAKRFRHPLFGNKKRWIYQNGQPYFFKPVFEGRARMIERAIDIINEAVQK
jgi:hypothetical protein